MTENVFVFGASGHGKVVLDALRRTGRTVQLLVDDDISRVGSQVLGQAVAGSRIALLGAHDKVNLGIVAIGDNASRIAVAAWLKERGFTFATVIDPSAVISITASIGTGTLILAQAVVNADSTVGEHVIINTGATVDHDCVVGDGAHLAPGVRLCGGVNVGAGALVGAGAVVVPGVRIGPGALVGAGSIVLSEIPAGARAAGNPCRVITVR